MGREVARPRGSGEEARFFAWSLLPEMITA